MSKLVFVFSLFILTNIYAADLTQVELKVLKSNLAKCSGNSLLELSAIKSQLLTFGSEINNEKAIKVNSAINLLYSEVGRSIKGDDFDKIAEEFYNSQVSKFEKQKAQFGAVVAKKNTISEMMEKRASCSKLLEDPKVAAYSASVVGSEKAKAIETYIMQNLPK